MAEGRRRAVRESLAVQAALVWGNVGDVGAFIEFGQLDAPPRSLGQAPPITPEVERHMRAQEAAGRFVMPDEVDKWLAIADERARAAEAGALAAQAPAAPRA